MSEKEKKNLKKIKTSVLSRSLSMAKMAMSTGVKFAGHKISSQLKSKDEKEKNWQSFLTQQSSLISQEIGELKGSIMKAGQMLSVYGEHFLPPEANKFLKTLQSNSPPLDWTIIENQLKKNFSPDLLNELEIEKTPIGSASLGQVYKAQIKSTKEWIALKVQYPDVDKAIDSDIKALKKILNALSLIPSGLNMDPLFDEVRDMLYQETDYEKEANFTEMFDEKIRGDSRFVVPKVYRRFSNRKIISTSFEKGLRVDDDVVLSLSQERRNQLGLNFLELFFNEFYKWKMIQTDPHIGNYRIRIGSDGRDQIILFDFGATRTYPDSFLIPYQTMLRESYFNNEESFYKAAQIIKFLEPTDPNELKTRFFQLFKMVNEPFLMETFDWKQTDLPQRVSELGFSLIKDFPLRAPPRELIFLDRKTAGVFVFLSILETKISGKNILLKYFFETNQ